MGRLVAAVDRGVRVRLLVDDLLIPEDEEIVTLDFHPNAQLVCNMPLDEWRGPIESFRGDCSMILDFWLEMLDRYDCDQ